MALWTKYVTKITDYGLDLMAISKLDS